MNNNERPDGTAVDSSNIAEVTPSSQTIAQKFLNEKGT